jgi:hypothetical protein
LADSRQNFGGSSGDWREGGFEEGIYEKPGREMVRDGLELAQFLKEITTSMTKKTRYHVAVSSPAQSTLLVLACIFV